MRMADVVRRMGLLAAGCWLAGGLLFAAEDTEALRERAGELRDKGNYKEAYELYEKLILEEEPDPRKVGNDLHHGVHCLQRLNRRNETDAFREKVIAAHSGNWMLLREAAQSYLQAYHYGYIVAGEFHRGHHRGGGEWVHIFERDRVRALQLMREAMQVLRSDTPAPTPSAGERGNFYLHFAGQLMRNRHRQQSWRLTYKTDLGELPDYRHAAPHHGGSAGAPVDPDGNPVFHQVPESWEAAATDGERWRWCLMQAVESHDQFRDNALFRRASFLHNQFGVQTLRHYGRWIGRQAGAEDGTQSALLRLHTLKENETVARLATGVKRFELPGTHNPILLFKQLTDLKQGHQGLATSSLAGIFEDRRQYETAVEWWEAHKQYNKSSAQDRIDQIVDNWGQFEPVMNQVAGRGATVDYRFRNGTRVDFTAHKVKYKELVEDVKTYIRNREGNYDHWRMQVENVGHRLVNRDETKYIGEEVAAWKQTLEPRPHHFDKRITVQTPLEDSGVYLLKAKMADGNVSRIIIWLDNTAIVRKNLDGKVLYYVADAQTGEPVAKANLSFFGYDWQHKDGKRWVTTDRFAAFTDAEGQLVLDSGRLPANHTWLVTATTDEGRLGYLGFQGVWYGHRHDREYHQTRTLVITDRPVYRPGDTVKYKAWVRKAQYDMEEVSTFAGQNWGIEIRNPRNEKVTSESFKLDAYGGLEGALTLGEDATLGVYRIKTGYGQGTFRVEEYKKPEFEVTVEAPQKPVMLGESITATVKADYYFGAPVVEAKVKYKVLRTSTDARWYPAMRWDWFYGRGYWWFAYDYPWYPGWREWGCLAPVWHWWTHRSPPPEVVAENEVEIGADGTVEIPIDTALAKAMHPDSDHEYRITAEVTDASRRTIVGTGSVTVAREPFRVYCWVDRGYYRVGQTIHAHFDAHTPANTPVAGTGELTLMRIGYAEDGTPTETPVQTWELDPDGQGRASQQMTASRAGQYRLSYTVTDTEGHTREGGYIFVVRGEGFDGREFRFNQIEVVTEKQEYAPGQTPKIMINTDRAGSTVLLFLRPTNGVYLPPKVLHLAGKSTVYELELGKKDMPNIYVEALTIADGEVHTAVRELVLPPRKRVLNVEVLPSGERYKPAETAEVKVRLTDLRGEPFVGNTVLTVYDKSVEYISGGSNVPDIKEHFWKWRRSHNVRTYHNLTRRFGPLFEKNRDRMRTLGAFGHLVADTKTRRGLKSGFRGGDGGGGGGLQSDIPVVGRPGASREAMEYSATLPSKAPMDEPRARDQSERRERRDAAPDAAAEQAGGALAEATVRKEFADTAFWTATMETDAEGIATVEVPMPENLTTWVIRTWAMGHGTRVGEGQAEVITSKDLIIRLQAPRFFVEGDEAVLSANVHNYLDTAKSVRAVLELEGETLVPLTEDGAEMEMEEEGVYAARQTVNVGPGGEERVDWRVRAKAEGTAVVRMKALTDEESDAMQKTFPVFVHGMDKLVPASGVVAPGKESAKVRFTVPEERRINASRLEIRYSPTLAMAMVDALPYLVEYPYGCTEQTLNRFLPTVVTQKLLTDIGVSLEDVREKRTNLNTQELGEPDERAGQWKKKDRRRGESGWVDRNPVWSTAEVDRMVGRGVRKLTNMQNSDGGWGWFSGWGSRSYPHTTAVVVDGLLQARENDVAIVPGVIEKGVQWLKRHQAREVTKLQNWHEDPDKRTRPRKRYASNLDALVYHVLSEAEEDNAAMRDFLYRDRTRLAVYSLAAMGLAYDTHGHTEKREMVIRNIKQYLVSDEENQTAWLKLGNGGYWWFWYGSEIEAHAWFLKLLARTEPQSATTRGVVKYLLNNRKHATYWNSTRDTAYVIEAFADYIRASGEDNPDQTIQVLVDGKLQKEVTVNAGNLFSFDNTVLLRGDAVETGEHVVELRREGTGPLYFNAYLSYFSLEDFITRAGLEVKVTREVYKLERKETETQVATATGQATGQQVEAYERIPVESGDALASGDLLEVELVIESKNDYEYLVFEDYKAAGCEPVEVRSGYTGNAMGAYVEFRDEKVSFFVRRLARGKHSVSYRLRAEIPGRFSALPARGYAMYAPELKGNSDEIKLVIED